MNLPPEPIAPDYSDLIDAIDEYNAALELLLKRYNSASRSTIDQLPTIALGIILHARLGAVEVTLQYLREDLTDRDSRL